MRGWWCLPVITALEMLSQEVCEFWACLDYIARPCLRREGGKERRTREIFRWHIMNPACTRPQDQSPAPKKEIMYVNNNACGATSRAVQGKATGTLLHPNGHELTPHCECGQSWTLCYSRHGLHHRKHCSVVGHSLCRASRACRSVLTDWKHRASGGSLELSAEPIRDPVFMTASPLRGTLHLVIAPICWPGQFP